MGKQAIKDLYEMKVKGGLKAWREERDKKSEEPEEGEAAEGQPKPEKKKKKKEVKSPYQIPVIQEFWWAYQDGGPDQDTVQDILNTKVEEALAEVGAEMEYGPEGIMQAISEESAVEMASAEESGTSRRRGVEIEKPSISMPYDWDDWDEDRAVEQLRNYLDTPPKRPEMEKQKRLFKEPKTEEEAKKKGITISKLLKNPLFKGAHQMQCFCDPVWSGEFDETECDCARCGSRMRDTGEGPNCMADYLGIVDPSEKCECNKTGE
jgi:hypothetical protein